VFKIIHIKSGKVLAWKEVFIEGKDAEKVKAEAAIAMKVDSPFVAPLLDGFEEKEDRKSVV
jgi:hypothetical protein